YLRQSTMLQVRDHTESTARQYALADLATTLGWTAEKILVIDADLGISGQFGVVRGGFHDVVAKVCLAEAGAVFGLEVSRLARSNADIARLLELARLTDTLVIDLDGVYDLADFNDRLLLGLKGSMSEAELHLLTGRLQGAKLEAARRGELRVPLPVGLVYDEDGNVVLDPDEEVRAAVEDVFAEFTRTGSAYGVVTALADRPFPLRAYGGRLGRTAALGQTHPRPCDRSPEQPRLCRGLRLWPAPHPAHRPAGRHRHHQLPTGAARAVAHRDHRTSRRLHHLAAVPGHR
ncbi:recombinase family protein, partial [Streptomyces sp. KLMMK]